MPGTILSKLVESTTLRGMEARSSHSRSEANTRLGMVQPSLQDMWMR